MTLLGGRLPQRLALRTGRGPFRPLWAAMHVGLIWAVARWVTASSKSSRIYLKGGFGFGEPRYGLSDVDMIVVTEEDPCSPGVNRKRVEERWRRLRLRLPPLGELFQLWVYEQSDVNALDRDSYLTFGCGEPAGHSGAQAGFLGGRRPHDPMALLDHPGLYGPQRDWRRVGSTGRPPEPISGRLARGVYAWLETHSSGGTRSSPAPTGRASAPPTPVRSSSRILSGSGCGCGSISRPLLVRRAWHRPCNACRTSTRRCTGRSNSAKRCPADPTLRLSRCSRSLYGLPRRSQCTCSRLPPRRV